MPAGWYAAGGDPVALDAIAGRRVWVDGFAARRDPVTDRANIAFLDDLVARGREAEALRHVPRGRASRADEVANPSTGDAPTAALPPGTWAPARGAYWMGLERTSRVCTRYRQLVELKNESIGIRLVRSL